MERKFTHMILAVLLLFGASLSVHAQSVLNKERRVSPFKLERKNDKSSVTVKVPHGRFKAMEEQMALAPVRRMATQEVDARDVVLLDSVIGDGYSKYYEYNEKGWLVSAKIYAWEDGLQLDTEESFVLEYDFDEQGHCVRYSYFLYNADATKGPEVERVEVTWTGGYKVRTEKYYTVLNDWNKLELLGKLVYDKYGNICEITSYDWDEESGTVYLEQFCEMKFTDYVMEDDEDGDLDFNEDLVEKYCYYYVDYQLYDEWNKTYRLDAFKIENKTEGSTITRAYYEIYLNEESGDNTIDLAQLDSYWELDEAWVITLTPSGTRYDNICYYEEAEDDSEVNSPQEDNSVDVDKPMATRASNNDWALEYKYEFEWDEYERLAKIVVTDCEDDEWDATYTCTYHNNEYKTITIDELNEAWISYWEDEDYDYYSMMEGGFYGKVHKERWEYKAGYDERVNDEFDSEGRVTHYSEVEVSYSEKELGGKDLNGDGIVSTEREVYNDEYWFTYDATGNIVERIEYSDFYEESRAYSKHVNVNEQSDGRYIRGNREYDGSSKEGPWTLVGEEIYIYEEDPDTNPNVRAIEGWYRYFEYDFGTWYGYKWVFINDEYFEIQVDPETGELGSMSNAPSVRSEELEEGVYKIYFEEDGWVYEGYKEVGYYWDELTGTDVLKVLDGEMRIFRTSHAKGYYTADDPTNNYKFPTGPYFWVTEYDNVAGPSDVSAVYHVYWDMETEKWIGVDSYTIPTHYTNEEGQVVNEAKIYEFDSQSERMKETGYRPYNIYSFDDLGRVTTIRYEEYTMHYTYFNDLYDYLLESYVTDNADPQGIKYSVCKYYYREGKYTNPETEVDLLESKGTWHVNGNTIVADGFIRLYNLSGQLVACGEDMVTVEQNGLYIIEVNGRQAKLWIK